MTDALTGLRGAHRVRAAVRDLAVAMLDRTVAHRAPFGHRELGSAPGPPLPLRDDRRFDPHDLGDDVAGALDDHPIAHTHVQPEHLVEVVKRRATDRRPADEHRREPCDRGEHAGTAHVDLDVQDGGRRLLRRELVRDRPARAPRNEAERLLIRDPVDLDDDAVGPVVEVVPLGLPLRDEREDLVDVRRLTGVRVRPQTELAQAREQRAL